MVPVDNIGQVFIEMMMIFKDTSASEPNKQNDRSEKTHKSDGQDSGSPRPQDTIQFGQGTVVRLLRILSFF